MEFTHQPVLLQPCIDALCIRPDGVYVDGTLGRAGHSREIARRLITGRLICIDRDMAAIDAARERLAPWMDRVTLVHSNFSELGGVLRNAGVDGADGMLFDLYGEERYAPAIARAIVRARESAPVETTGELVEIIKGAMPPAALREKQHPAKRSFQAIRIAVNGELDALPPMLRSAAEFLNPGGRLAVITFHSLEDRIVKRTMQDLARGCTCPPEFPVCVCGKRPMVKLVTRKPIVSDAAELAENPRARSAKLRVAERCGAMDL